MPRVASTQPSFPRPPDPALELLAGTVVGEYRIEHKLGHGGMGTVYAAVHPVIDKRVAIKVLHHVLCANAEAVTRFVQEARAVNRIGHPNIVDVFGFGTTGDGRAFLAMELLTGESLATRIARGALPIDEACDILIEITHALEAAHHAGIVHRDLKPDNVFLTPNRDRRASIKLLDFGIAKLNVDGGMTGPVDATQPGQVVGTPQYIAPEQARGKPLDGSADVYALGVMAFELFANRPPFLSDDPVELIAKHITLEPPAPSDFCADVPELADHVVAAMLAKEPAGRPSVVAVRAQLERIRTEPPSREARERSAKRLRATEMNAIIDAGVTAPTPWSRWWVVLGALVAIALGIKIGMLLLDGSDEPPAPPGTVGSPVAAPIAVPEPAAGVATPPPPLDPTPAAVEPSPITARPAVVRPTKRPPAPRKQTPRKLESSAQVKAKPVETKPPEAKPVEIKPAEIKPAETKPAETKPVTKPVKSSADDDALRSPFEKVP